MVWRTNERLTRGNEDSKEKLQAFARECGSCRREGCLFLLEEEHICRRKVLFRGGRAFDWLILGEVKGAFWREGQLQEQGIFLESDSRVRRGEELRVFFLERLLVTEEVAC